jgi:GNAT superfamily N-acetyltransferase
MTHLKKKSSVGKLGRLPVFPKKSGERISRPEVNQPPQWRPDTDEKKLGPRTTFADGIYIVTVSKDTPAGWIELSWKASIAAAGEHPGHDFIPGYNYDSLIAVYSGRVVGAAWARLCWRSQSRWKPALNKDGTAYSLEELTGEVERPANCPALRFDATLEPSRPTVMTMWVHRKYRRLGIGRQLVSALAEHFNLQLDQIGFRLPLSAEATRMVQAMGLNKIICGT